MNDTSGGICWRKLKHVEQMPASGRLLPEKAKEPDRFQFRKNLPIGKGVSSIRNEIPLVRAAAAAKTLAMSVSSLKRFFSRWFGGRKSNATKSELVGIYLTQTNGREPYSPDTQQNRQRRNSRYSHNRERA
ncbi:MAG: hypothetical protein EXS31_16520 [Pedosphaera sp.]|nr:hypothetical protein [Pedosphaera sp.]